MAPVIVTPDDVAVERSRDRRADCFTARTVLWAESQLERVQSCGRWSVRQDGTVSVRVSSLDGRRSAGFAGFASCGSVWACPVCSRKIAAERQRDLEAAVTAWEKMGGCVALGTYTVAHRIGNSLSSVWQAVTAGWAQITSGKMWVRQAADFCIEGWTRVIEVTHGDNGWHVHVHVVFFLHSGLGQVRRAALAAATFARWQTGIAKHGFRASAERGVDIKMIHGANASRVLSDYFTKGQYSSDGTAAASVALEATRGDLKQSRGSNTRTPFRVLYDFIERGDADDLALWHEWERGSKKRRQMAWSKGFREFLRLAPVLTDDEIAEKEIGSDLDDVVILTKPAVALIRYQSHALLDVAELVGGDGLRTWLDHHGIPWLSPGALRPDPD